VHSKLHRQQASITNEEQTKYDSFLDQILHNYDVAGTDTEINSDSSLQPRVVETQQQTYPEFNNYETPVD
jgi:hypothetical protein